MTNQDILQKAIEKAVENGWDIPHDIGKGWYITKGEQETEYKLAVKMEAYGPRYVSLNDTIFSHDFAKAFWGEEEYKGHIGPDIPVYAPKEDWQHHLQQLAIAEDRLAYIKEYL